MTLVEVLIAAFIIGILCAIAFPLMVQVRKSGNRAACISNLEQIGKGLILYRIDQDGAESGSPLEMGLPPHLGPIPGVRGVHCQGEDSDGHSPTYYITWPGMSDSSEEVRRWAQMTSREGSNTILVFDPFHQDSLPKSRIWGTWTVLGLKADSSVVTKTRRGFPMGQSWWK
ncbi:MAG: hypothetical protein BGO01_09175 [Armatimonadetes bacterium 55-13]|nr:MAG: hypothetical protein ABT09_00630 [bacterium SCN 57-13]OJU62184.1 MAG: hypothetical protein BGO01_09175 [Armatimonadetes bacterium 55-13]